MDLNGFDLMKQFDGFVKDVNEQLTTLRQDYFPETLGKYIVINAPWYFNLIWICVSLFFESCHVGKWPSGKFSLTFTKVNATWADGPLRREGNFLKKNR